MSDQELLEALCRLLGTGRLDNGFILPAVKELGRDAGPALSIAELLEAVEGHQGAAFQSLAAHLRSRRRLEAGRCRQRRRAGDGNIDEFRDLLGDLPLDAPPSWISAGDGVRRLRAAVSLLGDLAFLEPWREKAPKITSLLSERLRQTFEPAVGILEPAALIARLSAREDAAPRREALGRLKEAADALAGNGLRAAREFLSGRAQRFPREWDEEAAADFLESAFADAKTPAERKRILDAAGTWPTSRMAPLLSRMGEDPALQERAGLLLALRFDEPSASDWAGCSAWLARADRQDQEALPDYQALIDEHPAELLLLWARGRAEVSAGDRRALEDWSRETAVKVAEREFLERYLTFLTPEERGLFSGGARVLPAAAPAPAAAPPLPQAPAAEAEAVEERASSLWSEHLLPFLANNWTMLTGIAMVVAGSSLLAFYTWDKHWFVRYTVLPALLAGFTALLARTGDWLEKRGNELKATADMLRGAASALLPANFMAVALMARDPQVTHKELVLPVVAFLYLAGFGRSLRRWCSAVDPSLGGALSGALLLLNSLVLLGPFVETYDPAGGRVWFVLGAGFYAGFFLTAWSIVRFARTRLTSELVEEGRVPWFFGVTLTSTFLQTFVWVHGFMRHLPDVHTYAPMTAAAGGLVLFAEGASRRFRKDAAGYGKDSFIGYALILLGLFMGAGQPEVRLGTLLLAGAIWLIQAVTLRDRLHAWIAYTLLMLGGGSLGTWESFPGPWIPALGLVLAVLAGETGPVARAWWEELETVGAQMQSAVLSVTTVLAVLVQWHYHSPPLGAAAVLLAAAALFARRAARDQDLGHAHTTMAILAVALPYLGFADMSGRTLHGNQVVFGLSLLSVAWVALVRVRATPLLRNARSTVLLIYGAAALAAMCLRVWFEQGRPNDVLPAHLAMSLGGPVLIAAALVCAAYYSRSLLPNILAGLILIVLFPQLKAEIQTCFPFIRWGSGLMSSVSAVALTIACFALRSAPSLADLGEGDLFYGRAAFPLQQRDYKLFTWPLMSSAVFLTVKVDAWNLAANLASGGIHWKTGAALVLAGAAWTMMAVYFRERPAAGTLVHFGWISMTAGLVFGYYDLAADPRWHDAVLLAGVGLNGLYVFYRRGLAPGRPWAQTLLAAPLRDVLRAGSLCTATAVLCALWLGADVGPLRLLLAYSSIELCWFGLTDGESLFGTLLFFQTWAALLAWTAPGSAPLLERLTFAASATPTFLFFLLIQALHVPLEFLPAAYARLKGLLGPLLFLASLGALAAGVHGVYDAVFDRALSGAQQDLVLALVWAAARAQVSGPLALLGALLSYLAAASGSLSALGGWTERMEFLFSPWRLSSFALAMAAAAGAGEFLHARAARLTAGAFASDFFRQPVLPWIQGPSLLFAFAAVVHHAVDPALRNDAVQLWSPYLSAAAFALVGLSTGEVPLFAVASLLLADGNIHAVRYFLGARLRGLGLLENHLFALGATATLLQFSAGRLLARGEDARVFINRVCLAAAGFVLILLTGTYFTDPNIEAMTNTRFVLSGLMAYLAGLYFKRAARRPDPGEASYAAILEGAYHFGVTTAIWCAALLIPSFRNPYASFPALGLPALYFYARAEAAARSDAALSARYRNSAAALAFFLLALYAFRGAFQLVLFPGAPIGTDHYHFNAPFVMILSLVMLRLHGLGGTEWLAFYGGLAMMAGSYFELTSLPGLSPFDFPIPGAWSAFGLGHFWMLFSSRPSPLKSFVQRVGAIDEARWIGLRRAWGLVLLGATQFALLWGLLDCGSHTKMAAPLLLGAATLLAHQGWIRKSSALYVLAAIEALAALHMDFLLPSWLPRDLVVWVLLAVWTLILMYVQARPRDADPDAVGAASFWLGVLVVGHVFYHGPDSTVGLWAFGEAAALAALTPRRGRRAVGGIESLTSRLLLAAPIWLVYFGLSRREFHEILLWTAASILGTGAFARWTQDRGAAALAGLESEPPRLYEQTLTFLVEEGRGVNTVLLYLAFALTAFVQADHYGRAFAARSLALILGLYGASAAAWWHEGRLRRAMPPYFMMQFCVLGFFAVIRRQLMLTVGYWNYEYDVWASLLVSFSLAGAKQILPLSPREVRIPLLGTLLAMPVAVMIWVLLHGLGTNTVLLVVGLYSLMFAYMGRDDGQSPYHIVAVGGFVAFVLIVFWSKLELRVIQAYVIPVGLGILLLLQMFRDKIPPAVRNDVRAATLLAMLASAGYYALVDDRYPVAFHMTMLVLSVGVMAVGAFLRVRLYLLLGFGGFVVDLAALLYKVLIHMERSARMTLIGGQVLVFGAVLICGAVVYKTNQEKFKSAIEEWRLRLRSWD